MARPMSPSQMIAALRAEGVQVAEWPGWRGRCRCHDGSHETGDRPNGRAWGEVYGIMIHHTGSDAQGDEYVRNVLASGYSGLPGPLCHAATRMSGEIVLVGSGRANHAGGGDPAILRAVKAESYTTLRPTVGNLGGTDGNRAFYGNEVMFDGGQPMTPAQEDAAVRWAAAICRFHGWSEKSVIGHGEWSRDKWDPGHTSMAAFREKVRARLASGTTTPNPATVPELEPLEVIMSWYESKKDFETTIRAIVAHEAPRAPMKSHVSLNGGVTDESTAAAIRRAQTIGRQNREKLNHIEGVLDGLVKALKAANIDLDLDVIAEAARAGAAQGAADVAAEDVAAKLTVTVKGDAP